MPRSHNQDKPGNQKNKNKHLVAVCERSPSHPNQTRTLSKVYFSEEVSGSSALNHAKPRALRVPTPRVRPSYELCALEQSLEDTVVGLEEGTTKSPCPSGAAVHLQNPLHLRPPNPVLPFVDGSQGCPWPVFISQNSWYSFSQLKVHRIHTKTSMGTLKLGRSMRGHEACPKLAYARASHKINSTVGFVQWNASINSLLCFIRA
jgi:hypothetical protein